MRSVKLQEKLEKRARTQFDRWKKIRDKKMFFKNQEEEFEIRVGLAYLKSCLQMYYYDQLTMGHYSPPKITYNEETNRFTLIWKEKDIQFIIESLPSEDYHAFMNKMNSDFKMGKNSVDTALYLSHEINERQIQLEATKHLPIRGPIGEKEKEDAIRKQRNRKYSSRNTVDQGQGGKSN